MEDQDFGYVSEEHWRTIGARFRLSPRERQLLPHILAGRTAAEMARSLHISSSDVLGHLNRLYCKVGARDRIDLVMRVIDVIAH